MLMGTTARRLLASPGFAGCVMAVVSNAVYLLGAGGEVLWLSPEGMPAHARCVLGPFAGELWHLGATFTSTERALCFQDYRGYCHQISMDGAALWAPPAPPPGRIVTPTVLKDIVGEAFDGWGDLCRTELGDSGGAAKDTMDALRRACAARDLGGALRVGKELVGLGPGLTPSGDDFLGGLLFAAYHLRGAFPRQLHWDEEPVAELIDWARERTNPISWTLLGDLARGDGPEPLHGMMGSLLTGRTLATRDAAVRLLEIGHATGRELLAGALTGLLLIFA